MNKIHQESPKKKLSKKANNNQTQKNIVMMEKLKMIMKMMRMKRKRMKRTIWMKIENMNMKSEMTKNLMILMK